MKKDIPKKNTGHKLFPKMHSMQIKWENITLISIEIILICYECMFIVFFIVYKYI